ncbi:MAG: hypothetical protein GC206_16940 [Alphaproteobacteria bacterium]|nr:hypothetical protein [Alphaproteobacteria bacterium]
MFDRYPLARRMEALARVIAAPERVIRRLAVMLRTQRDRVAVAIARVVRPNPRAPADLEAAATLLRLAPPADTS